MDVAGEGESCFELDIGQFSSKTGKRIKEWISEWNGKTKKEYMLW